MIQEFESKNHNTATNAVNDSELPNSDDLLADLLPNINAFDEIHSKLNSVPEFIRADYDEDVTGAS